MPCCQQGLRGAALTLGTHTHAHAHARTHVVPPDRSRAVAVAVATAPAPAPAPVLAGAYHFSVRYWVLPTTKLQRSPVLLDSLTWSRSWQSCLGLMVRFELGVQLWPQLHSSFRSAKNC